VLDSTANPAVASVLVPDLRVGCSLAVAVTAGEVHVWRAEHPHGIVVSYEKEADTWAGRSSQDENADCERRRCDQVETDCCCTSANGVDIVRAIRVGRDVLFLPANRRVLTVAAR
jgi:quinolinate synthase